MSKSIMQERGTMKNSIFNRDKKEKCFICGRYGTTEFHHIFYGTSNRKWSEKYGLKVHLCHWCHNEPPYGVHFNKKLDTKLKQEAQKKAMEVYNWSTEEFIKIFGRNWI